MSIIRASKNDIEHLITLIQNRFGNVDNTADANKNVASAAKWTTARNINGMTVDGSANRTNYGTCSTAAATAAKTVACTGFALVTGAEITVKFTVTNTAFSPTLNVNGTGAKAIYYRGSAITAGYLAANRTYTFRYNGTQYDLVGDVDTNSTYSAAGTSLGLVKSGGDVTISNGTITVNDDSHNHTIGNVDGLQTALDGKLGTTATAAAATKLANARDINLSGDASGSASFNGTQDVTISVTIPDMVAATSEADGKAGFVPAPSTGEQNKFLRGDGTWQTPTNTTYSTFKAATSSAAGGSGLVPAPAQGYQNRFLRGDATWQAISLSTFGVTATAAELNKLDGVTATATEINYLDGVTSSIQTQLNGKAASSHTHDHANITGLTASRALVSNSSGVLSESAVTSTELGYLDGVTSNIQNQLNGKLSTSGTAAAASKLATARTITLSGDASGSVSFDGSANVTLTATVKDDSHSHTIANVDNLQTTLNGKATQTQIRDVKEATLTSAGWSGSGPYTQSVTVTGISASDTPLIECIADVNSASEKRLMQQQWNKVDYIECAANKITATCNFDKPTVNLSLRIKGI